MQLDWSGIDTVLLDMDGTLLDLHFDNQFWLRHLPRRFAALKGLEEGAATEVLHRRIESQRGSLNWYCLDYWARELEVDIVGLKREIAHLIAVRPHVERFLQWLRASHRRTILVTNSHQSGMDLKFAHTGLAGWVDEVVCSHDYGAPKESPLFWQALQRQHPFNPARTLLIDDTESILQAAADFGVAHLLTLRQPDSQAPLREGLRFAAIHHFDELLPAEAVGG